MTVWRNGDKNTENTRGRGVGGSSREIPGIGDVTAAQLHVVHTFWARIGVGAAGTAAAAAKGVDGRRIGE